MLERVCTIHPFSQALVSSLHESGVLPTVALQRGGSLGGGGSGPVAECGWSCCLRSGAVAVHAAGESGGEHELGDSVLGSALATARVAGIQAGGRRRLPGRLPGSGAAQPAACTPRRPPAMRRVALSNCGCRCRRRCLPTGGPAHLGLGVDLHWRRMGAPPPGDLLEGLWAAARGHSGGGIWVGARQEAGPPLRPGGQAPRLPRWQHPRPAGPRSRPPASVCVPVTVTGRHRNGGQDQC